MDKKELEKYFHNLVDEMKKNVDINQDKKITTDNIFQPTKKENRKLFKGLVDKLLLDGSEIVGAENLKKFYDGFKSGKSSLIMSEHKSNFDVPVIYTMMNNHSELFSEIFEKIVFIAGRKLNEEAEIVRIITSMFHRIVIIPKGEEIDNAVSINMTAQRIIRKLKQNGKIIFLFPTGTREREWLPETTKGIRETYNYITSFDNVVLMNIKGNNLIPSNESDGMLKAILVKDKIIFSFSKIYNTKEVINTFKDALENSVDKKQFLVDKVMDKIRSL